jgi:hypothetical protein
MRWATMTALSGCITLSSSRSWPVGPRTNPGRFTADQIEAVVNLIERQDATAANKNKKSPGAGNAAVDTAASLSTGGTDGA